MANYGYLQFAENIMVARRSEMSADWKVRFAISIASIAIQVLTKLLFSFSDVLKAANCIFQEVDNIFCLAVGIAVYDEFFSCICAAEFLCALNVSKSDCFWIPHFLPVLINCYHLHMHSLWIWSDIVESSHVYISSSLVWNKDLHIVHSYFHIP